MRTILVIDIGGTNVKFGFTVAAEPHVYMRLFSANMLRSQDPISSLVEMISFVIEEAGLKPDILVATVPGFSTQMKTAYCLPPTFQNSTIAFLRVNSALRLAYPSYWNGTQFLH